MLRTLSIAVLGALCAVQAQAALVISAAPTGNVDCSGGTCTATAADAVLNVKALRLMLNKGDVTLVAGSDAQDIVFADKLVWAKNSQFTLDAARNVEFREEVLVEGSGNVALSVGGDLAFSGKGKLSFNDIGSAFVVNGQAYTLVSSIKELSQAVDGNVPLIALSRGVDASGTVYATSPVRRQLDATFEGLGHAIENLTIDGARRGCLGLFKLSGSSSVIRDLRLLNVNVTAAHFETTVGSIVGCGNGAILNSSAQGTVSAQQGASTAGGLAGTIATIENSSAAVDVGSGFDVKHDSGLAGGLAGGVIGEIVNSHSSGKVGVSQNGIAGGLAGYGHDVSGSYATGDVGGGGGRSGIVGGLLGGGDSIAQSWSSGAVTAGRFAMAGGLVGKGGTVVNSYSVSPVAAGGQGIAGGLAGEGGGLSTSWSSGAITNLKSGALIGGSIGKDDQPGGSAGLYWDLDTSGIADPAKGAGNVANDAGITGLTTTQFQSGLPSGFDPAIWGEDGSVNGGYPYLLANPPN